MKIIPHVVFANVFGAIFQSISLLMVGSAFVEFYLTIASGSANFTVAIISAINTFIVALAMFELGLGINEEYQSINTNNHVFSTMRRTITRFVGTVCIALVLEALIMIIKYSELELSNKMWYPVGIIVASSLLLVSLGLFLHFTKPTEKWSKDWAD